MIALTIGSMATAGPAWYSNQTAIEPVPQETIAFRDLNLSNPKGVEALYRRITTAAKRVCKDDGSEKHLGRAAEIQRCEADAIRRAVAGIGNVALNGYWMRKIYGPRTQLATATPTR